MSPLPITALFVEDSLEHSELIQYAFTRNRTSLRFHHVTDGDIALNWLQARSAEELAALRVILLDLKLPRMDGFDLLRCLKAEERFADIPVVMMTTSASPLDLRRAYDEGVNSYLVKAEGFPEMMKQIEQVSEYWGRWNQRPPMRVGAVAPANAFELDERAPS